MMPRIVQPEWLDRLSPDDPRAIASRADLRRINRLMGHPSKISRLVLEHIESQAWRGRRLRIADMGGGDGTLLLRLARDWSRRGILADADILDTRAAVRRETTDSFCQLGWSLHVKNVDALDCARSWLRPQQAGDNSATIPNNLQSYDIILSNLFLHHFIDGDLAELLAGIAVATRLFIACEPRRSPLGLWAVRALRLIGCTAVTLHDAKASVYAGFTGEELSHLWPGASFSSSSLSWRLTEGRELFSHYFVATRP